MEGADCEECWVDEGRGGMLTILGFRNESNFQCRSGKGVEALSPGANNS